MRTTRRSMWIGAGALALGGAVLAPAAADTVISHEASPADGGYADVVVTTGAELAGEWLSVLILDEDADADAPAAGDIVFVEQRQLDDDGGLAFRVLLPSGELGGYDIALNTAAATERYLAPLDGIADPEPEPTDGPTDGPGDGPDGEPTGEPTDGPGTGPSGAPGGDGGGGTDGAGADGPGGAGADGSGAGVGADGSGGAGGAAGGQLSQTGAPVLVAVVVALGAIAGGVMLRVRRSRG